MKRTLLAALLAASAAVPATAAPIGTKITYQGQLTDGQSVANNLYDFEVCLFDDLVAGNLLACAPAFDKIPVEQGLFTLEPDFGGAAFNAVSRNPGTRRRGHRGRSLRHARPASTDFAHAGKPPRPVERPHRRSRRPARW